MIGIPAASVRDVKYAILLGLFALTFLVVPSPERAGAVERGDAAYVDVAVATLWTKPDQPRETVDRFSYSDPVDINRWVSGMSLAEKDWLIGKTQTQALFGQRVRVLERRGGWTKVAVAGQPTPKNRLGYPGWVPTRQITSGSSRFVRASAKEPFAQVERRLAVLYDDREMKQARHSVSFATRLPVLKTTSEGVRVAVPGGPDGWLRRSDVTIFDGAKEIPEPSRQRLVRTAEMFRGLSYLWAGTSGYAFDCSGFTHTVYRSHGITIPRDAQDQARAGKYVASGSLRSGDLVFFATNGSVHHVGLYVGNGRMIHAPNHSTKIEVVSIDGSGWGRKYAGARRYL